MAERFDTDWLAELAGILGYKLTAEPNGPSCCYKLEPTEAATFHQAGLNVIPVEAQLLDEWEMYSKLAFGVERFVAELISQVRQSLADPGINIDGEQLRDLARFLKLPLELMTLHLNWRVLFKLAESLLEVAKRLHAAEMHVRG